jgi:hypothetical protein
MMPFFQESFVLNGAQDNKMAVLGRSCVGARIRRGLCEPETISPRIIRCLYDYWLHKASYACATEVP